MRLAPWLALLAALALTLSACNEDGEGEGAASEAASEVAVSQTPATAEATATEEAATEATEEATPTETDSEKEDLSNAMMGLFLPQGDGRDAEGLEQATGGDGVGTGGAGEALTCAVAMQLGAVGEQLDAAPEASRQALILAFHDLVILLGQYAPEHPTLDPAAAGHIAAIDENLSVIIAYGDANGYTDASFNAAPPEVAAAADAVSAALVALQPLLEAACTAGAPMTQDAYCAAVEGVLMAAGVEATTPEQSQATLAASIAALDAALAVAPPEYRNVTQMVRDLFAALDQLLAEVGYDGTQVDMERLNALFEEYGAALSGFETVATQECGIAV